MIGEPYIPGMAAEVPVVQFDLDRATSLATFHARRLARSLRGAAADEEDLIQALLLAAIEQWSRFDPDIAASWTFLNAVIGRAAITIFRRHKSLKRGGEHRCVSATIDGDDLTEGPVELQIVDRDSVRQDLQTCLSKLDESDQILCILAMTASKTEIAKLVGKPRNAIAGRLRSLRPVFEQHGFGRGRT